MSEWRDRLERGLTRGDAVRYLAVDATSAANETRRAHGLAPAAARLGAELVIASALMSAYVKGSQRITVQLQTALPRAAFMAEVDAQGHVRARVTPSEFSVPDGGRLHGILVAINADETQERYRGSTEIRGQTIEEAIAAHLTTSNQVDALLRIGVTQDPDGTVTRAVGVLVERLPMEVGHPSIDAEAFAAAFAPFSSTDAVDLHDETLAGELCGDRLRALVERDLRWQCRCSQEKVEQTLTSLGAAELTAMRDEDGQAEVICHFCNTARVVDGPRLTELLARLAPAEASGA